MTTLYNMDAITISVLVKLILIIYFVILEKKQGKSSVFLDIWVFYLNFLFFLIVI